MDAKSSNTRPPTRRKPLGDATFRANMNTTPPRNSKIRVTSTASGNGLPHHESLMPNGPLTVRNVTTSPANKRLSALTNEEHSESKRYSQVSTTSTNASSKGRRRKTHIGPWQLGSDVGKGGCGKVRKVRHSNTGQQAAVKIISKVIAERARAESLINLVESSKRSHAGALAASENVMPFGIEREVVIMKLLEHPNVVKLYDVWENRNELYLIMEYVDGGELFEYVDERECVAEDETVFLFRQIVAALLHCHRLGIHHRDLKPENILIDRETLQIKLVDFGMAALQPKGKMLTTPCGSIHYAAPEVFEKNYDGSKVDVWSLGIILYVMLTGATPFHYDVASMANNVGLWYGVIKSGRFPMPKELSKEAQDLISKMLMPNPKQRINLEGVWNHAFVHKFESEWGEDADSTRIEKWIGPRPFIENWTLKQRSDIDREILRNLRTLWHSEREEVLIQRLLTKEPNQEKYFYSALEKHREEQLENYVGTADGIAYSASDHHHVKPVMDAKDVPPVPPLPSVPVKAPKSKSAYSILNDEHLSIRNSLHEPPPSIGSYDPFRASRDRIVRNQDEYVKVNVLRGTSLHSRKHSGTDSVRNPASLRVEALKSEHQRTSRVSSAASLRHSLHSQKSRGVTRRSISRSSVSSSMHTSSSGTPGVVKLNMHKRAVNFSHVRRSSTASAPTTKSGLQSAAQTPDGQQSKLPLKLENASGAVELASSPSANVLVNTVVRSRKESLATKTWRPRTRKAQTHSEHIESEARKVSSELEKFCEEVFNRSSAGSSNRSSATPTQNPYETPTSSVSNHGSGPSNHASSTLHISGMSSQRPLPNPPSETSNIFIVRELAETRKRLAARYAEDENANNATYHEVLAHLDALLQPNSANSPPSVGRRAASAPGQRSAEYQSCLPIISEEGRQSKQSDLDYSSSSRDRRSTDPPRKLSVTADRPVLELSNTIRLIDHSPPPRIAPLVIRKASGSSTASQTGTDENLHPRYYGRVIPGKTGNKLTPTSPVSLDQIAEEAIVREVISRPPDAVPRKMNWFRRRILTPETVNVKRAKTWEDLDDHVRRSPRNAHFSKGVASPQIPTFGKTAAEAMQGVNSGMAGKRPGFLRFLIRKRTPKQLDMQGMGTSELVVYNERKHPNAPAVEDDEVPSMSSVANSSVSDRGLQSSVRQHHTLDQTEQTDPRDLGVQRNWLSRFLHIKPAAKILCFNTGRGQARQEVVRLLRSWRQFGMRDIVLDRARNLVFARLDAANYLGIKEVSFVVEMYVMLQKGRRARLCVSRFTQRKGAVSSFRRVLEAMESMLRGRGLLVEDRNVWTEMEGVLMGV